jgi:hypothetical protein
MRQFQGFGSARVTLDDKFHCRIEVAKVGKLQFDT